MTGIERVVYSFAGLYVGGSFLITLFRAISQPPLPDSAGGVERPDDGHGDAAHREERDDHTEDKPPLEQEVPDALGDLLGLRRRLLIDGHVHHLRRRRLLVGRLSGDDRRQRHDAERDDSLS